MDVNDGRPEDRADDQRALGRGSRRSSRVPLLVVTGGSRSMEGLLWSGVIPIVLSDAQGVPTLC